MKKVVPTQNTMSGKKRKPRTKPTPYPKSHKTRTPAHAPETSAISKSKHASKNLTLFDWLTVVAYCDTNPSLTQEEIVKYFANKEDGALIFSQPTLCRHLSKKGREADNARLDESANALSSRRARVVTRPDIDKALMYWFLHMEEKGELVSGPMLIAKREKLEIRLEVPEEERLTSTGWLPKFYKA